MTNYTARKKYFGEKRQWQIKMNKIRNLKIFINVYPWIHMYINMYTYEHKNLYMWICYEYIFGISDLIYDIYIYI